MSTKVKLVAPKAMKKKDSNGDYMLNVNPQTLQPVKGGKKGK